MYLNKKTYIGNNYKEPEDQTKIDINGVKQERITYVVENVGYWRKANAIHQWFVDNVQNGVDECQESYVSKENIKELLRVVNIVLTDCDKAHGLLPACDGFFFGGRDYDEWYFQRLRDTKNILESAIAESGDFYYQASW
jgi:hypothetical protein